MLPVERVIGNAGLTCGPDGTRIAVRLPWYRSLPLSTVEVAGLAIDGAEIAPARIAFELDGARRSLDDLAEAVDAFWFVLDEARLVVADLALEPGSAHEISATIALHPPYIPGMRRANTERAVLTATAETAAQALS